MDTIAITSRNKVINKNKAHSVTFSTAGSFAPGALINLFDVNNNKHTYQILQNNSDGSSTIIEVG
jgi:hypothetical protein